MKRLALSDSDKQARDWFAETAKELGCKLTVDEMGNMFAVRPGLREGPPTFAGSHLDTQPSGGRYDGILGVTAGVEMLKTLNDNWIETEYPVGVVNWTKYVQTNDAIHVRVADLVSAKKGPDFQYPWCQAGYGLAIYHLSGHTASRKLAAAQQP